MHPDSYKNKGVILRPIILNPLNVYPVEDVIIRTYINDVVRTNVDVASDIEIDK